MYNKFYRFRIYIWDEISIFSGSRIIPVFLSQKGMNNLYFENLYQNVNNN